MTRDQRASSAVDTSTPSIARTYDACLGGKDNFEVDRAVLRQILEVMPEFNTMAEQNRDWLIRVVRFLAREAGIDQFLDVGSGLPTRENTHQAAQRVNPEASVVYVDNDPACVAFGQALLEENARTRFVSADLTDPDELLAHPRIADHLDFRRPIGLIQCSTAHHIPDEWHPEQIMDAYRRAMPSGSYLALAQTFDPEDGGYYTNLARGIERTFRDSGFGTVCYRGRDRIRAYFGDWELVEPGLTLISQWWPDRPHHRTASDADELMLGGVARKP